MSKRISSKSILKNKKFKMLKRVGGHKIYHQEGNALRHSILVRRAAEKIFKGNPMMQLISLVHDIGKLVASQRAGKGDWTYPNHAKAGGAILSEFIPEDYENYHLIKWYIENHIKPLFWKSEEDAERLQVPEGASLRNLARLALCDLCGSYATKEVDNTKLIKLLKKIGEVNYQIKGLG